MRYSIEVATEINMDLGEAFIEEVTFGLDFVFEEEFTRKFRGRTWKTACTKPKDR